MRFASRSTLSLLLLLVPATTNGLEFRHAYSGGNCTGCEWIAAEGSVEANDAERLREFVDAEAIEPHPAHNVIHLNSLGGSLVGALKLGEAIRELGFSTSVGATSANLGFGYDLEMGACASACALAFLGGKFRYVPDGEVLGFHQFFDDPALDRPDEIQFSGLDRSVDQVLTGIIVEYIIAMGVDPRLYKLIATTPPKSVYWIDKEEAIEFGIDNSIERYTEWTLRPFAKGVVIETISDRGKVIRAYCRGGDRLLTYIVPGGHLLFENILAAVAEGGWSLELAPSRRVVNPIAIDVQRIDDKQFAIIMFISDLDLRDVFVSEEISMNYMSLPRVFWDSIEGLSFKAVGDQRVLDIAMRNCI